MNQDFLGADLGILAIDFQVKWTSFYNLSIYYVLSSLYLLEILFWRLPTKSMI